MNQSTSIQHRNCCIDKSEIINESKIDIKQALDKCNQKIVDLKCQIQDKKSLLIQNLMSYVEPECKHPQNNINANHLLNIYHNYEGHVDDDDDDDDVDDNDNNDNDDDEQLSLQQLSSDPSWHLDASLNIGSTETRESTETHAEIEPNDSTQSNKSIQSNKSNKSCKNKTFMIKKGNNNNNNNNNTYFAVNEYEEETPPQSIDIDETYYSKYEKYVRICTQSHNSASEMSKYSSSYATKDSRKLNIHTQPNIEFVVENTLKGHRGKIYAFDISPDSSSILSFGQEGFMILWDINTQQKRLALKLESKYINSCSYLSLKNYSFNNYSMNNYSSSQKTLIACGGLNKLIYIYDLTNTFGIEPNGENTLIASLKGHNAYISDIKPFPNFKILTSSGDSTCILWDIVKTKQIQTFKSENINSSDITSIEVLNNKTNDDNMFISGSVDGYIRLYDPRQKLCVAKFGGNDEINHLKCFKTKTSFCAGFEDGSIRFYDIRCYQQLNYYSLNNANLDEISLNNINGVSCIDFSKSGSFMFNVFEYKEKNSTCHLKNYLENTASSINNCIVRHTVTRQKIDNLISESPITYLNIPNNGQFVVTSHINKTLKIWKSRIKKKKNNQFKNSIF